jgi:eukaryotic-like serine/threonine-protein kinase
MSDESMTMPATTRPIDEWLLPGTELGRHRIAGKLAEGAHAILYMGEHVQTRAEVAIKVQRGAFVRSPEMLARFDREAVVIGRLAGSRTVVQVHDAGALPDGRRYLVMEFVRGRELSTMLVNSERRGVPLELERVVAIAADLAAALRDAHGKGVVHRDLKPGNVMIVREPDGHETAKLVDFGISGDRDQSGGGGGDLTMTGSVIGTPEYMSPEQSVGLPAAPAMDLFALGVVLFEMITGSLPPRAALRGGTVPPASSLRAGVPASLDELVRELLMVDPKRRPEDAIAVLTRLAMAREQLRGASGPNAWAEGRPLRAAGAIEMGAAAEVVSLPPRSRRHADGSRKSRPRRPTADPRVQAAIVVVACLVALAVGIGAVLWWSSERGGAALAPSEAAASIEAIVEAPPPEPTSMSAAVAAEPEPTPALEPTPPAPSPVAQQPEPAARPEPVAQREPTMRSERPSAMRRPVSRSEAPAVAAADDVADCEAERAKAERASADLQWTAVLERTRKTACWPDGHQRLRLRVAALAELGRFEGCVREGSASNDVAVQRIVELCKKRIDAG